MTKDYGFANEIPLDLRDWMNEGELVSLAREIVQNAPVPVPTNNDAWNDDAAAQRMLVMLACGYAAGLYCSAEFEWATNSEQLLETICGRRRPSAGTILGFRTANRRLIEECLANMFEAVVRSRRGPDFDYILSESGEDDWAISEAQRRVQLAVVLDLALIRE
jgi:hypothetical protein